AYVCSALREIHPFFCLFSFFFTRTATTYIYTLSLHDALPICPMPRVWLLVIVSALLVAARPGGSLAAEPDDPGAASHKAAAKDQDRKSTRLNSSHGSISYAVFCLKKKKKTKTLHSTPHH